MGKKQRTKNNFTRSLESEATTVEGRVHELTGEGLPVFMHERGDQISAITEESLESAHLQLNLANTFSRGYKDGIEVTVEPNENEDAYMMQTFTRFFIIPSEGEHFFEYYIPN